MLTTPALFLALLLVLRPVGGIDYCRDVAKDCGSGTNIVCRRQNNCGTASNCAKVTIHKDIKDVMVDKFNDIRNKVALGQGPISGNSRASNMQAISWDDELAYIAQCAVNVCEQRLKKACPVSSKYSYGHILYTNKLMTSFDDELDFFEQTVIGWIAKGKGMSSSSDYKSDDHYDFAAIIMAKGVAFGCGWSRVKKPVFYHGINGHFFFAACVFAAMPREAAYQDGAPCSKCPSSTSCNSRYKALCGEIQYAQRGSNEDDDYYDYHDAQRSRCVGRRASLSLLLGAGLLIAGCQVLT